MLRYWRCSGKRPREQLKHTEQNASQKEAELLAEIAGGNTVGLEQSKQAKEKARKKKEKKQRQLEAKRRTEAEKEAASRVALRPAEPAEQLSGPESEVMEGGELAEGQKTTAKKKKTRNRKKTAKKSELVDLGYIVEPGAAANAPAPELELEPEQDEVALLLHQLGLSEHLERCFDNEMDMGASATLDCPPPLALCLWCVCARDLRVGCVCRSTAAEHLGRSG